MKPRPRIRKTIKWGSATIAGTLLLAWFASGPLYIAWEGPQSTHFAVATGRVFIGHWHDPRGIPVRWPRVTSMPYTLENTFSWQNDTNLRSCGMPIWAPMLAVSALAAFAWNLDVRARRRGGAGHCPKCDYDCSGITTTSICPECGSETDS